MTAVHICFGVALVCVVAIDVFGTLFHPAGRGALSDWISKLVWRFMRQLAIRTSKRLLTLAGPFAVISIIGTWLVGTILGFALIFAPFMSTQFALAPGLDAARHHTFLDAINVSLGSLITVGGDFNAKSRVIRLVMGCEAIAGFALLSASLSWLLSIYPVLERRRTTGHELSLLHHAEMETGISILNLPSAEAQEVLWGLAAEISTLRNDLTQFPISYYFHPGDDNSTLAGALPYIASTARAASRAGMAPSVRIAGVSLGGAIDDYLELVAKTFLSMPQDDKNAILARYAEDQLDELMRRENVIQFRVK